MNSSRCLATLFAIGITLVGCGREETPIPSASPTVTLRVVHGPEVRALLSGLREQYQETFPTLADGTRLALELTSADGATAARKIASGEIKAEAWVASSTSLVSYANATLRGLGARQSDCTPLFSSPIVIATRPEHRDHFNPTGAKFSWRELFESRLSKAAKDPHSGYFSFSHAAPEGSVTGFDTLLQLTRFAAPAGSAVTADSLKRESILKNLERYESVVSNYSLSEPYLLERTARSNARRIRLTLTSEQQLSLYNMQRESGDPALVALYPAEGSMFQDYQLCVSEADWVTPAHRAAIRLLSQLLTGPQGQGAAKSRGFRPTAPVDVPVHPLSPEYGVDLDAATTPLPPFDGAGVAALLTSWDEVRRPAAVAIVLDNSGSMEGDALREAKEQLRNLVAHLTPRDMKALVSFSTTPRVEVPFTTSSSSVIQSIDSLTALGGSAVYDGIRAAVELLAAGDLGTYRKTIVVVTDGEDKNSEMPLQGLLDLINTKVPQYDINIIIIGVSREGTDLSDLQRITRAANGLLRTAPIAELPGAFEDSLKSM